MSWIDAILIGVVQGVTECLPVSSSGHLILAENLLGLKVSGVALEAFLHLGTLGAAVAFFRERWGRLIINLGRAESIRFLGCLAIGSLPIAFVGFLLRDTVSAIFHNVHLVAANLVFTGIFLLTVGMRREGDCEIGWLRAFFIGLAQAVAILPGISRSGMTVGTGLVTGLKRPLAVEFAFMLAVPAVLGAVIVEIGGVGSAIPEWGIGNLIVAGVAAFLSGYLAIGLLLRFVMAGRFVWFGYYCILAGVLGFIWG